MPDPISSPGGTGKFRQLTVAENFYRRVHESRGSPRTQSVNSKSKSGGSGGMTRTGPPKLLMCYLCGQQFGSMSLSIHQPQCYYKKLLQWENADPGIRGPRPLHPEDYNAGEKKKGETTEDYNDRQFQQFTEGMVQCDICFRKFLPDRLVVHKRSCREGGSCSKPVRSRSVGLSGRKSIGGTASAAAAEEEEEEDDVVPSSSSSKHLAALPPKVPTRSKSPTLPSTAANHTLRSPESLVASSVPTSITAELIPCPTCGRKYLLSKLEMHSKTCRGSAPGLSSSADVKSNLVQCQYCERTFDPSRIAKHEDVCIERKNASSSKPPAPKVSTMKSIPTPSKVPLVSQSMEKKKDGVLPTGGGDSTESKPKFCMECGTKLGAKAGKFCSECGARIDA